VNGPDVTFCYRHGDRRSGVVCQRCDRPICGDCMTQASVGFHCPECTSRGGQRVIHGPVAFDPVVTKVLVALNVAASLGALVWGGSLGRIGGRPFAEFALFAPLVDRGEYHRIFSSALLHDGLIHLAFNMWALWVMGPMLERLFGARRFVALYGASLLGGAFGALLLSPLSPAVGASGAVFGLFGAAAVVQRSAGFSIWQSGIGPILAINLLITFAVPQISIGGHLGGLLVGIAVAGIFVAVLRARRPDAVALGAVAALALFVLVGCIWAAAQWTDPLF